MWRHLFAKQKIDIIDDIHLLAGPELCVTAVFAIYFPSTIFGIKSHTKVLALFLDF